MKIDGHEGVAKIRKAHLDRLIENTPETPGTVVLELGTYDGVTASVLAKMRPNATVISVDQHLGDGKAHVLCWYLNREPNQVAFIGWTSAFFALRPGIEADVVLVDADHSEAGAFADLCMAGSLLAPGGVMFAHDVNMPEVGAAVDRFLGQGWSVDADRSDDCLVALVKKGQATT